MMRNIKLFQGSTAHIYPKVALPTTRDEKNQHLQQSVRGYPAMIVGRIRRGRPGRGSQPG
jgi:hypothetical protein